MVFIAVLIFLLSILGLIVSIISPRIFSFIFKKHTSRKTVSVFFISLIIVSLFLIDTGKQAEFSDFEEKTTASTLDNNEESLIGEEKTLEVKEVVKTSTLYKTNLYKEQTDDSNLLQTEEIKTEIQGEQEVESEQLSKNQLYSITKVVDGDTVIIDMNGTNETLRLIGIDTPETVHPSKPVECFGKEASAKAKEILNNQKVYLEFDESQGKRDKYGRLLAYIFLEDNTNFNHFMISEGYAYEYTYNLPYKYQETFKQAKKEASENKKGLWADKVCDEVEPEELEESSETMEEKTSQLDDCECGSNIYNCGDFNTHNEAQAVYECCLEKAGQDIHRLDRDNDALACESLP